MNSEESQIIIFVGVMSVCVLSSCLLFLLARSRLYGYESILDYSGNSRHYIVSTNLSA